VTSPEAFQIRHGPFGISGKLSPDGGEPLRPPHRRDLLLGLVVVAADGGRLPLKLKRGPPGMVKF
jgi:hypothetical protein